ncbi:MAG TPA: bifunctional phosphoglucose/phosphomannose isomerase [Acidobacteriota bacterium]|nr:bifunctional phosphoglucose/phosphomannose isomerase [Acidobacteriota bacterium]
MKTRLDHPGALAQGMVQGTFESLRQFGQQLQSGPALASHLGVRPAQGVRSAVYCGLGGSGIAGDLLQAALGEDLRLPWLVHRSYGLPPFADRATLAVISSYSGNTEEALDAFAQARAKDCRILCVTSGGELLKKASADQLPCIQLPSGLAPRNSLGYALSALLCAVHRLGLAPDPSGPLQQAAESAHERSRLLGLDTPLKANPAKHLARRLHGRLVLIYGGSGLTAPIARRWRGQITENAKQLAWTAALPEMNHNEIAGWEHPHEVLKHTVAVFLRDQDEHPRLARRFDLTRRYLQDKAGDTIECDSNGESRLDRMVSLLQLIDWASVYLAILNGSDPESIEAIEHIKRRLSEEA